MLQFFVEPITMILDEPHPKSCDRCGGLYHAPARRSKKMAVFGPPAGRSTGHIGETWSASALWHSGFSAPIDVRSWPDWRRSPRPGPGPHRGGAGRAIPDARAKADALALRPDQPATPIWALAAASQTGLPFQARRPLEVIFRNDLPVPLAPVGTGSRASPRPNPWRPGRPRRRSARKLQFPIPNAGTFLCDFRRSRRRPEAAGAAACR